MHSQVIQLLFLLSFLRALCLTSETCSPSTSHLAHSDAPQDFADDIALTSHRHQDMQEKTDAMALAAGSLGPKISSKKTKNTRMITRVQNKIQSNGEGVEEVDDFTYLGCKMVANADGEVKVRARLSKASQAFASFKSTWTARNISQKTKIRIFKSNVISTTVRHRIVENDKENQLQT